MSTLEQELGFDIGEVAEKSATFEKLADKLDGIDDWYAEGRKLAKDYSRNAWKLADWILKGDADFNVDDVISPSDRWMLINPKADAEGHHTSAKLPNFYKDTAAVVGLSVQTLKNRCFVAGRFPKKQRIKALTFSHHAEAASVEDPKKRRKYLLDCLNQKDDKGEKLPARSVVWLREHIAKNEHKPTPSSLKRISLHVPLLMFEKLELLAWDESRNKKNVNVQAYLVELLKQVLAERQANIDAARQARKKVRRKAA